MKDNFFIKIESFHSADKGTLDNVKFKKLFYQPLIFFLIFFHIFQPFDLKPSDLKKREVIYIDIANDPEPTSVS